VYRVMKPAPDGLPECSCEPNKLGATPKDLEPRPDGTVAPEGKGMSVTADPRRLPGPLRPERFPGGSGRLPLYQLDPTTLGGDLVLHPLRPRAHAVVQPSRVMHVIDYQRALWRSRPAWQEAP
jgi:hypothetical protein